MKKIHDLIDRTFDNTINASNKDTGIYIPSGFEPLDSNIMGFRNGDLITLGARTEWGRLPSLCF